MHRLVRTIFTLSVLVVCASQAAAGSPTLERIAKRGTFRIGYVPDAPPMSFRDKSGAVTGYTIDLCRTVADAVQKELALDTLTLRFIPLVAPGERLRAVQQGDIDLECAASTMTMSRRERVDFSLLTYITGGSVLSLKDNAIVQIAQLDGKRVAVIPNTTTERALRRFRDVNDFEIRVVPIDSHADGLSKLDAGEVDAYASDRAMLIGQARQTGDAARYTLAADVFSFEPYALMLQRGDSDFRLLVDRALATLYRSARIQRLHYDWFGEQGGRMPAVVEAMYEFQAVED
jgi:ABC-type amino acid transport substrate-binding protein